MAIVAVFNHLTRTADATGIEPDYESPLPRLAVDPSREPMERPAPEAWPSPEPRLSLSLRPATEAAIIHWRAYVLAAGSGLSARDRAVLARTAAHGTCDAAGVAAHADAIPSGAREIALSSFADKLTRTPWRMAPTDLDALRGEGLDDRALLHAIAVVGYQNMESRVRLALGSVAEGDPSDRV